MDSRVAILGANGAGKSTLLHLITGALQPSEGTISKHAALKLAKYSQHSADQLPYDKSPIEYFQALFAQKYPEKDMMVRQSHQTSVDVSNSPFHTTGVEIAARAVRSFGCSPNIAYQPIIRWTEESVSSFFLAIFSRFNTHRSVVFAQLAMEHPHVLLLGL
jgi:ATP-binding cassette, subfamily F, member 2